MASSSTFSPFALPSSPTTGSDGVMGDCADVDRLWVGPCGSGERDGVRGENRCGEDGEGTMAASEFACWVRVDCTLSVAPCGNERVFFVSRRPNSLEKNPR